MIAFAKNGNVISMQSGVRFFGWAKTNYIIAKHVYTRRFAFSIVRDRSFLILVVLILDRAWLFGQDAR